MAPKKRRHSSIFYMEPAFNVSVLDEAGDVECTIRLQHHSNANGGTDNSDVRDNEESCQESEDVDVSCESTYKLI